MLEAFSFFSALRQRNWTVVTAYSHNILWIFVPTAMAQPVTHPAKEGVATFRSCADPARAHSFRWVWGKEFSMEQTLELLTKVGRKLDFQCADLLAWTIDLPVYVDNGNTRRGTFKVSQQSCVCGFGAQAECLQTLSAPPGTDATGTSAERGSHCVAHFSEGSRNLWWISRDQWVNVEILTKEVWLCSLQPSESFRCQGP